MAGGYISFDGVANGMAGDGNLLDDGSTTLTQYLYIQPNTLAAGTRVFFETGTPVEVRRISIIQIANLLIASAFDTVPLPNSKQWTIPNTNPILICFQVDTNQVDPDLQTALFINNSTSGVSSVAAPADLNGLPIGAQIPYYGARANAASNFAAMNAWRFRTTSVVDDATARGQVYDRVVWELANS